MKQLTQNVSFIRDKFMVIIEIEYFKGDTLLYGQKINEFVLHYQIKEIENSYDRNQDNFVELLCSRFGWTVYQGEEMPDFIYDRDIGRLYRRKVKI